MELYRSEYQKALDKLYNIAPSFQKVGKAGYNPGLDTMLSFAAFLGNPQRCFKSIHVAGTNGKGSVSSMIASVLMGLGYRVGLYTSPHLVDFRERIRVDGEMISQEKVLGFLDKSEQFIRENSPSFFEITTALAFEHFAQCNVDYAVIECGLGGRLDSTNIITPDLSVITSIGLDHTDILGNTEEKIAFEKGGIIKDGVPVVVGDVSDCVAKVLRGIAQERHSPISFVEEKFEFPDVNLENVLAQMDLKGWYQRGNLQTVIKALDLLLGFNPSMLESISCAAARCGLRGRWEILSERPLVVCDIAHNPHGMAPVMEQLKRESESRSDGKLFMVFGVMADKDLESVSGFLPRRGYFYFTQADSPRAMDCEELRNRLCSLGFEGESEKSIQNAVKKCLSQVDENDVVYIGGSSYVVAEALRLFEKN